MRYRFAFLAVVHFIIPFTFPDAQCRRCKLAFEARVFLRELISALFDIVLLLLGSLRVLLLADLALGQGLRWHHG